MKDAWTPSVAAWALLVAVALGAGLVVSGAVPLGCGGEADARAGGAGAAAAGITWSPPVELARGGGEKGPWQQSVSRFDYVDDPTVALEAGGAAIVAWVDHRLRDVRLQIVEPDGRLRLPSPTRVSRTPAVFSWLPRLVLAPHDDAAIVVAWQEIVFSGGSHGGDIHAARSSDGGRTFGPARDLSASRGGDGKGRISREVWHNGSLDLAVAPEGELLAAWTEFDGPLWLARSTDGGDTWSTPVQIAGDEAAPARAPALAIGPRGQTFVAWTVGEDAAADIRVARVILQPGVAPRTEAPRVVARTAAYDDAPKLAVDGAGRLHLAFAASPAPLGPGEVLHAWSDDGVTGFTRPRVISRPHPRGRAHASFPALALDDTGRVVVAWEAAPRGEARGRGLAIAVSRDRGATFSTPALVPGSADRGWNGSHQGRLMRKLAVRGGAIAVVNSSLRAGQGSRVWLVRGALR